MSKATAISIKDAFKNIIKLTGRTHETTDEESENAFAVLSDYRDGAIFIGEYDGYSEWERHSNGDEFVYAIEGETTMFLLSKDGETANVLKQGEIFIVPENVWHRFETPNGMKVMTITPHPTDHSVERPTFE